MRQSLHSKRQSETTHVYGTYRIYTTEKLIVTPYNKKDKTERSCFIVACI